jgi:molecular chaperone DnaJ
MPRDYYEVLGVARDSDEGHIKKAFRRLARELHPDVNAHDPDAESKFKEAAEAYEVLSDAERRRMYDAYGHEGLKSGGYSPNFEGFGSISDLFSAFFGAGGFDAAFGQGRQGRGGGMQGGDVAVAAPIDLAEAAHGTRVEVAYDATVLCETCRGNGAEPGTPIVTCPLQRLRADAGVAAHPLRPAGPDGDLRSLRRRRARGREPCATCDGRGMEVRRQKSRSTSRRHLGRPADPDRRPRPRRRARRAARRSLRGGAGARGRALPARRRGPDHVVDVAAPLAALGTTIDVPTLDGPVPVEVPAGTQPGETILLRGRGMPPLSRGRTGDLRVVINVAIPRRLTGEQRELFERLADTLTDDNGRADEGMLAKLKRALAG